MEFLKANAGPELAANIEKLLDTGPRGEYETPWLVLCFRQTPMMGAVNILSSMQANLRFAEAEVLRQIIRPE